jgi:hypothetical protein
MRQTGFERCAKDKENITYDSVPWPAMGGLLAEFVIDFHAESKHFSAAEKRQLVLHVTRCTSRNLITSQADNCL